MESPSSLRAWRNWHKTQRMPEIIFDCCCLSNFALSDSLFILETLFRESASITNFVSSEILKGIQQGYKDLVKVQNAMRKGWLREIVLSSKKERSLYEALAVSLGIGEASSIALAKSRGCIFACDDRAARREAGLLGVKLTGPLGILKDAVQTKTITLKEADLILARMIEKGFYSAVNSLKEI
jgi:predicted nucleic acid-binding protein